MVQEFVYTGANTTVQDLVNYNVGTLFGLDFTLFAIASVFIIALMLYKFNMPAKLALPIGWVICYMFDIMAGGSPNLQLFMFLLIMAMGILVLQGILRLGKQWSQ